MARTDRLTDVIGNAGFKNPCRVATTGVLAALAGLLTVDAVALEEGDRVLVKDQASAVDNGIYVADTGTWSRAADSNGVYDLVEGALVFINAGTTNSGKFFKLTTSDPVIGTSSLSWSVGLFSDLSTATFTAGGAGAVAITAQAKMRQSVSVLDYGAVGDGLTHPLSDRYATLAAAQAVYAFATALTQEIDYCASVAAIATGKRVIWDEGYTFLVDATLTCGNAKQEMCIRGAIKLKTATNKSVFTVSAARVKIRFEGGEIDGNAGGQTTINNVDGSGIWILTGVHRCEIWDPYIHDTKRCAIAGFGNSNDCSIIGGSLETPGLFGVFPAQGSGDPCKRWVIGGVTVSGWSQDGIGTVGIQYTAINGCRFLHPSDGVAICGIALEAECNNTTVSNCTFFGTCSVVQAAGNGIQVNDSRHVTVTGCTFEGLGIGLSFHGGATGYGHICVANNFYNCGYAGQAIRVVYSDTTVSMGAKIHGCTIKDSPYSAIHFCTRHGTVTNNTIEGVNLQNTASKRFVAAIALFGQGAAALYNTIANNDIREGATGNMKIGIHECVPSTASGAGGNFIHDNVIIGADYDIVCSGTAQTFASTFSTVRRLPEEFPANFTATPTTGHWEKGQTRENQQPAIGDPIQWVCTTGGTFGAQAGVAAIANGSTQLTFANAADAAKFHSGMKIRVAGAGVAAADLDTYIFAFDGTSLTCTLKDAAGTLVAAAAVTCIPPTFTSLTLS